MPVGTYDVSGRLKKTGNIGCLWEKHSVLGMDRESHSTLLESFQLKNKLVGKIQCIAEPYSGIQNSL